MTTLESRIQPAEMEKHAHGCLTDEASIMARDGAPIAPASASGVKSMIEERELELLTGPCPPLEWALSQRQQDATCGEEACPAMRRARMVEKSEIDKHAQGLLQDEFSIRALDTAKMREGKHATMVRQAEKEKHAHGHLQDERAIMEANMPAATSG
jgi:hypothetical protein